MSGSSLSYDKSAIIEAEEIYKQVKYEGVQRRFVDEIANIMSSRLNINELPLRGFMLKASKKWQMDKKIKIQELADRGPSERINAVREIMNYLKQDLLRIVQEPEMQGKLNEALKDGFALYLKGYAGRVSE